MQTVEELTIREAILRSGRTAQEKGWWSTHEDSFPAKLALVFREVSEALEHWRDDVYPLHEVIYVHQNGWSSSPVRDYGQGPIPGKPDGVAVELADAIIRIFDIAYHFDIPLEAALLAKMEFNATRPFRHGGKKI